MSDDTKQALDDASEDTSEMGDSEHLRLAKRLKEEAREYLGLSQEMVSERLSIPRASISAMETGRRKVSSIELRQLASLDNEVVADLFRTASDLSDEDKDQVLRFARFLKDAGAASAAKEEGADVEEARKSSTWSTYWERWR